MLDRAIVNHASPTLARLKLGNLFNYPVSADFDTEFADLQALLAGKGVALSVLRQTRDKALVYVYRADGLARALRNDGVRRLRKKIDAIEYITTDGLYRVDTDIPVIEDERMIALAGTYIELFPEFAREDMKDYWMECIRAWNVDDEAAEGYYQMLTGMFMGKLYGQEAVDAYSEHPEAMLFDCYFENGVAKFTIAGDEISGVDAEGNELFRHAYAYVDDMTVTYLGQEMENYLHIFKTEDADAGIFTYFAFSDDTLAETQHIEFRYGETLDDMANYSEGQYAYWLASGTLDGYKDSLLQDCIKLFVDENVGEAQAEAAENEAAVEAGAENYTNRFVGRWSLNVADYPAFAEEGLTDGTITLEFLPDGTASTWYNDMQTSTYGYFTYMNYYVAVTPDGEAESSVYAFSDDGLTLTLTDMNGEWELAYHKVTDSETKPEQTGDDAAAAAQLLEDVKGTYVALFPVITAPEYDQIWLDPCVAVVGEEAAPGVAEMLKFACNGTIYGQEAVDAFGDGSNGAQFNCAFINGVDTITFDGATISGTLEDEEVFRHEYAYVGPLSLGGMMDGTLYETSDADAGEFRYFFMMSDTPATTYHLEFRYGSDVDALTQYNEGPYAYWLAAGFPVDADEAMIENVITLFCEENLAEMGEEEPAA